MQKITYIRPLIAYGPEDVGLIIAKIYRESYEVRSARGDILEASRAEKILSDQEACEPLLFLLKGDISFGIAFCGDHLYVYPLEPFAKKMVRHSDQLEFDLAPYIRHLFVLIEGLPIVGLHTNVTPPFA